MELESAQPQKPKSNVRTTSTVPLRIRPETKKTIMKELVRINKEKQFGNRVKPDAFISLAIGLLKPEHYRRLADDSMTNKDRVEQKYQEYMKTHGPISKDDFFGILLAGSHAAQAEKPAEPHVSADRPVRQVK